MGVDCGYGNNVGPNAVAPVAAAACNPWTSTGTILVLYILLVIILKTCWL